MARGSKREYPTALVEAKKPPNKVYEMTLLYILIEKAAQRNNIESLQRDAGKSIVEVKGFSRPLKPY